jgi:STE24 endopeptidase
MSLWATECVAFQMFMVAIYPTIIQPLFNKVEPLKDGSLKQKIEELAQKTGFPLSKLFVIDGSKRSSHSNGKREDLAEKRKFLIKKIFSSSSSSSSLSSSLLLWIFQEQEGGIVRYSH